MHRLSPSTHASLGTTTVSSGFVTAFLSDSTRACVAANENVYAIDATTHNVVATIPFNISVAGRASGVVTTPPPFVPPPAPANLRATVVGNRVSLTWDAPATAPAGYVVEGGVNPGEVLAAVPVDGTPTSFAFDAPTGVFYVRLHAWTASGRSPASNELRICVNVPQSPSAPTGLLGLARVRRRSCRRGRRRSRATTGRCEPPLLLTITRENRGRGGRPACTWRAGGAPSPR